MERLVMTTTNAHSTMLVKLVFALEPTPLYAKETSVMMVEFVTLKLVPATQLQNQTKLHAMTTTFALKLMSAPMESALEETTLCATLSTSATKLVFAILPPVNVQTRFPLTESLAMTATSALETTSASMDIAMEQPSLARFKTNVTKLVFVILLTGSAPTQPQSMASLAMIPTRTLSATNATTEFAMVPWWFAHLVIAMALALTTLSVHNVNTLLLPTVPLAMMVAFVPTTTSAKLVSVSVSL